MSTIKEERIAKSQKDVMSPNQSSPEWTPTEQSFLSRGQVLGNELFVQARDAIELIEHAQQARETVLGLETFALREDGIYIQSIWPKTDEVEDLLSFLHDMVHRLLVHYLSERLSLI